MPTTETTQFRNQGALEFIKTHAICPIDNSGLSGVSIAKESDHHVIQATERVCLFEVREDTNLGSPEHGSYKLITRKVSTVDVSDRGDYNLCYYLPWNAEGGITEMKLTASDNTVPMTRGRSGAVSEGSGTPAPTGRRRANALIGAHRPMLAPPTVHETANMDPDLFFTTQLSGCSVFVRGTQYEPTVYHAGAGKTISSDPTTYWHNLFVRVAGPKATRFGNFLEVNKSQYHDVQRFNVGTTEETHRTNPNIRAFVQQLINQERAAGRTFRVHVPGGWGNVFGIRTDGKWSFYKQEVCHLAYARKDNPAFNEIYTITEPVSLAKVFPTFEILAGPGHCVGPLPN